MHNFLKLRDFGVPRFCAKSEKWTDFESVGLRNARLICRNAANYQEVLRTMRLLYAAVTSPELQLLRNISVIDLSESGTSGLQAEKLAIIHDC